MTRESLRRLRYAPETALVEFAVAAAEYARVALVAEHPRLHDRVEFASREERLAYALVRAIERLERSATRYLAYVDTIVVGVTGTGDVDPRQLEMF